MGIVESWELARDIGKGIHDESKPDTVITQAWVSRSEPWEQEIILRTVVGNLLRSGVSREDLKKKVDYWIMVASNPHSFLRDTRTGQSGGMVDTSG